MIANHHSDRRDHQSPGHPGDLVGLFALWLDGSPGTSGMVLVILETFLVKAIALPYMMHRTVKKHGLRREMEPWRTNFQMVLATLGLITGSLVVAKLIGNAEPSLSLPILGAALASIAIGLLLIITRNKLITHVLGYLVMENGIFLLVPGDAEPDAVPHPSRRAPGRLCRRLPDESVAAPDHLHLRRSGCPESAGIKG